MTIERTKSSPLNYQEPREVRKEEGNKEESKKAELLAQQRSQEREALQKQTEATLKELVQNDDKSREAAKITGMGQNLNLLA
ncbi:MAG: hypothetical protein KU37_09080 [Sulfuricurvum sp. PC08-66]|nr:MAG: hypothetical protein KU37_09080 [Sulfuricurvum sp. PC08-66]